MHIILSHNVSLKKLLLRCTVLVVAAMALGRKSDLKAMSVVLSKKMELLLVIL